MKRAAFAFFRTACNVSTDIASTSVHGTHNRDNSGPLPNCTNYVDSCKAESACHSENLRSPLSDTLFMQSCNVQSPAVDEPVVETG